MMPHLELRGLHWLLLLCSDRTFTDSRALVSKYVLGITLARRCFDRKLCMLVLTLCRKLATYLLSDRLLRLGCLNRDQRKLTELALTFALPLGSTEYVIRVPPLRMCVTHDKLSACIFSRFVVMLHAYHAGTHFQIVHPSVK